MFQALPGQESIWVARRTVMAVFRGEGDDRWIRVEVVMGKKDSEKVNKEKEQKEQEDSKVAQEQRVARWTLVGMALGLATGLNIDLE
jgi:hypothetical protein